jgi:hypothetical protein
VQIQSKNAVARKSAWRRGQDSSKYELGHSNPIDIRTEHVLFAIPPSLRMAMTSFSAVGASYGVTSTATACQCCQHEVHGGVTCAEQGKVPLLLCALFPHTCILTSATV